MATARTQDRPRLVRRGRRLEYFTVWNSCEALVSISAGLIVGSVALVGFGLDSVIEVASGMALLWRLHHDLAADHAYETAAAASSSEIRTTDEPSDSRTSRGRCPAVGPAPQPAG